MLSNGSPASFFPELKRLLVACGYRSHKEGIYTRIQEQGCADWLSIGGNSYFYTIDVGVVFTDLSTKLRDTLPAQAGMKTLDGIAPSLIPFVLSPAARYVELPERGKNPSTSSILTVSDAHDLGQCLCVSLPPVLLKFRDLKEAVLEVEQTLETGGVKAFLLVLAYLKLGRLDDAAAFSRKALMAYKSVSTRLVYESFLQKLQIVA